MPKPFDIDEPEISDFIGQLPSKPEEPYKMPAFPKTVYHQEKLFLGKPPKPLKNKPYQKVPNTIPMPMTIKNVPFKPVQFAEPRRGGAQPSQSPPKRSPTRSIGKTQSQEHLDPDMYLPVRYPEKNQIAIQQLTLADSQQYERVILGDVDK